MRIELHISDVLHKKIPDLDKKRVRDHWDLPDGSTIQYVLELLHLSGIPVLLMLNDRQGERSDILNDGDILKIFGVLAGG